MPPVLSSITSSGDENEHQKAIRELMLNLPFVRPLDTSFRYVMNSQSRKVHLTISSCLPAVSMRAERRFYANHMPLDGVFCKFCEDQVMKIREEKLRDGA